MCSGRLRQPDARRALQDALGMPGGDGAAADNPESDGHDLSLLSDGVFLIEKLLDKFVIRQMWVKAVYPVNFFSLTG